MYHKILNPNLVAKAVNEIVFELGEAQSKHSPLNSLHEAYSVILEEVDEFWDQVKLKPSLRNHENIKTELIQIAAMAIRTLVDLEYDEADEEF